MIKRRALLLQLKRFDKLYNESLLSDDINLPKYYSRLAVLELGSWVQGCMEEIIRNYPKQKRLNDKSSYDYVNTILDRNSGFDYKNNFRRMLKSVSGIVVLERVEKRMNPILKQGLDSALTKVYPERNDHTHKPLQSAPNFTSPSICISLFSDIYSGLEEYERHLKKIL